MSAATISSLTALPLRHLRRGKVREVYEVDDRRLLIVATDRVSAFDVVMNEPVAQKGAVLTQLTAWWLRQLESDVRHHMLASDVDALVAQVPALAPYRNDLAGRAMLCRRTQVFPLAWSAATCPGPRGRNTESAVRWPVSRCPRV